MNIDFKLCIENWNFVDKVGYPADGEWCFIITQSRHGCLYDWSMGGYNAKHKTFYVNYGMGGLVEDQESVLAWKAFTDFQAEDNNMAQLQFLTVNNVEENNDFK
ncbi:MAG: hypothetical protein RR710_04625 [Oscillospiraceae bacterium]